jgi:D-alanyl-D-alanine carboxypeptidase/D-alanyl-D-alanine-endopeptidase (penicillin-binding protein 4)
VSGDEESAIGADDVSLSFRGAPLVPGDEESAIGADETTLFHGRSLGRRPETALGMTGLGATGLGATAVLLASLALGPAPAAADPSPKRLAKAIDALVARPELAAGFWGIEVRSLATGRTLYSRNATHAFRPASTMKLLTTAAALDAYGPEARVRTTVETAGRQDALGRILGDVYLVGRGDPNLSSRFHPGRPTAVFEAMADALAAAGIRRIEGRVFGHEGAFADERWGSGWTWEDLAWGYGAPVSALSFEDNHVEVTLAPGERPGDPAVLETSPRHGCVVVTSSVLTAEAARSGTDVPDPAESVALLREPGSDEVRLAGQIPLGGKWDGRLAVLDPARCASEVFAGVLEAKGIRVIRGVATTREPLPAGMRVLAAHDSETMAAMIRVVNKESQNLHAETLLRLAGAKRGGEGSVEKGHAAVADLLDRVGVPRGGLHLVDGSGLARTNLLTPRALAALLVAMDRHPHAAAFRDSLAVAGRDGTLEKRMKGTPAEGRVVAKTGTLALVNALAGHATTRRGERLAFAVFVNNHAERSREAVQAIDAIATVLSEAR